MIELFVAFGAGLISFLSPCVLPLIPGYISYISGSSLNELLDKKKVDLFPIILFTIGFSIIFITFGAAVYIFYDSIQLGNFFGDLFGLITALGLAIGAVIVRSAKNKDLVPAAVAGKLMVAVFALFFVESFKLFKTDIIIVPLMCVMCVALPFVLVTIAPRFISAAEVNLFFLLETVIGPIWVWLFINEQPTLETIQGGSIIILTIAIHSFLKIKNS